MASGDASLTPYAEGVAVVLDGMRLSPPGAVDPAGGLC